jgi:hypothetical protein
VRASIDEESRQLLRRIVESMARRQLSSINILGHCLKYIGDLDTKVRVASELDLSLRLFREVHTLYGDLGWTDLESAVRDRLGDIPYPESRLEFGLAYYLRGLAERVAMRSYLDSSCPEFTAIARSHVEAAEHRPEPQRFIEYCRDPSHRPQAQQFLDRWYTIALRAFGRPGSPADARAVELGLRSQSCAAMRAEFVASCEPLVTSCGLVAPVEEEDEAGR